LVKGVIMKRTKINIVRMSETKMRKMLLEIVKEVDYDIWKNYIPETAEEPELAEERLNDLVSITKKYIGVIEVDED
jgi:hypothetical protein